MSIESAREAAADLDKSFEDPVQAQIAARKAFRQCRLALDTLEKRLVDEGFPRNPSTKPNGSWLSRFFGRKPPLEEQRSHHLGVLKTVLPARPPAVLALFWEQLGTIDFTRPGLPGRPESAHERFFSEKGVPAGRSYPLRVEGPTEEYVGFLEGIVENYKDDSEEFDEHLDDPDSGFSEEDAPELRIPVVTFFGEGGTESSTADVLLGDDDWIPTLQGFSWPGAQPQLASETPDFFSFLRASILECGGFPGLYGEESYEPLRRRLVDGLPVF